MNPPAVAAFGRFWPVGEGTPRAQATRRSAPAPAVPDGDDARFHRWLLSLRPSDSCVSQDASVRGLSGKGAGEELRAASERGHWGIGLTGRKSSRLQNRVRKALAPLLGLPLSDMWRAAELQIFEFGEQRPDLNSDGKEITRADYAMHVSCPWRIIGPAGLALAREDYWTGKRSEPRHARSKAFFERMDAATLAVEEIEADTTGGVRLLLAGGCTLEVLPMTTRRTDEHWRLLPPGEDVEHFVVTGSSACLPEGASGLDSERQQM